MNETALESYLRSIEYENKINIIGAWDRGSRAWNLNTSESDYDIRICYTQPYSNYIMSSEYTQSIKGSGKDLAYTDLEDLDISPTKIEFQGWDIRRFIKLLSENNPSILECLASPISYQSHPIFEEISTYALNRIHPIELWNHYYSASKRTYKEYITSGRDTSAKKTLFIFRNILCGEYIRYTHEFPIIDYYELLDSAPDSCFKHISKEDHRRLMNMKINGNKNTELGNKFESEIESYLDEELEYQNHIPDKKIQMDELDEFVEKLIHSTTMFM